MCRNISSVVAQVLREVVAITNLRKPFQTKIYDWWLALSNPERALSYKQSILPHCLSDKVGVVVSWSSRARYYIGVKIVKGVFGWSIYKERKLGYGVKFFRFKIKSVSLDAQLRK